MKIERYYTLVDCFERDMVLDRLDELQNDNKLEYLLEEDDDTINIIDTDMDEGEVDELLEFFKEKGVNTTDYDGNFNIFLDGDDFSDYN